MFQQRGVKKSGRNTFSKYSYFELDDIVPAKTEIFSELGLCDLITFNSEFAVLTLINTDDPNQTIEFSSPMRELELKGANAVQLLGGVETYQRRYLYMVLLDIVENDQFDQLPPDNNTKATKQTSSGSFADEVKAIVAKLEQPERKAAGEIVKSLNGGSAEFWNITDTALQNKILTTLKEKYHV